MVIFFSLIVFFYFLCIVVRKHPKLFYSKLKRQLLTPMTTMLRDSMWYERTQTVRGKCTESVRMWPHRAARAHPACHNAYGQQAQYRRWGLFSYQIWIAWFTLTFIDIEYSSKRRYINGASHSSVREMKPKLLRSRLWLRVVIALSQNIQQSPNSTKQSI